MRHLSAWVACLFLTLAALAGRAQGPAYGDWQLHLPSQAPLVLAEAGNRLYVGDTASFYYYDRSLGATRFLSRRDGLSDVNVKALAYDSASAQLVVVYRNGNIDLLGDNGTVTNITDLLRKQTQVAKGIRQVQIYNGLAYVSTNLGVVVLNLARREISDTYGAIGPGGTTVTAYATAVVHDTILAATSAGVLRGRLSSTVNLLDYRSWTLEPVNPQAPTQATVNPRVAVYRGHAVAVGQGPTAVSYVAGTGAARAWRLAANPAGNIVRVLHASPGGLLVGYDNGGLRRFDAATGRLVEQLPASVVGSLVRDAVRYADGTVFVAAGYPTSAYPAAALLRFAPGSNTAEVIRPNGPATSLAYGLVADAATNTVDVLSGGYSGDNALQFVRREGFYEYTAGQWTNYTSLTYPSPSDFPNLPDLSHGTRLNGALYMASYGNGLLEWKGPGQFRQFTFGTPGSPLRSSLTPDASYLDFVRVTDVTADPSGKYLWVVNYHQRATLSGLFRLRPANSTWLTTPAFPSFNTLDRVVVDAYGNPWATVSRHSGPGLVAYDTLSQQGYSFTMSTTVRAGVLNSGLPSNTLYALARDRKGAIWIGTDKGVVFVADPSPLLSAQLPDFTQPIVRRGSGTGFPALYNETIRCIAVDGANRKWFGTPNGLWLFSADADQALLNFTTANSPLPSNSIVDVAVNDKTGEVFVATDAGLVSYQGSASLTEGAPNCAEVFPNPVRPEFAGTVGIRGVVDNAQVKITDIAGHLVYSTTAAGGTITWNLTDVTGQRVRSGVYLVLSSDAQGQNTCVSKVAVLSK